MSLGAALAELFPGRATYTAEEADAATYWWEEKKRKRDESAFEEAKGKALLLDGAVKRLYAGLQRKDLVSTATFCKLVSPDVFARRGEFHYMGRAVTGGVIDFICNPHDRFPVMNLVTNPALRILFITGTPGAGKSVSVMVAAGYLHFTFTRSPNDKRRIGFLNVRTFIENPGFAVWSALILAFINDAEVLNALRESFVSTSGEEVIKFLQNCGRADSLYLIFDDGNKLDAPDYSEQERRAARKLINGLAGLSVVVICSSVRSKLRQGLMKDTRPKHHLICGGYTDEEMDAYSRHVKELLCDPSYRRPEAETKAEEATEAEEVGYDIEIDEEDLGLCRELTGCVPRLVYDFFKACLDDIDDGADDDGVIDWYKNVEPGINWYKTEIKNYMEGVVLSTDSEFVKAVRGEPVSWLTEAMDSRAFYRGRDGRGKCLTIELQSYTLALLSEKMTAISDAYAKEAVEGWVRTVRGDKNAPRIGWNAEEATILTFKLLKPSIGEVGLAIQPSAVRTFPKTFSRQLLEDAKTTPTLHVPQKFNHIGADVYYSDSEWVVVVQISIANKAKDHHKRTLEVAADIFRNEPRRKLLIWVVRTGANWLYLGSKALSDGAEEITLPFSSIHPILSPIDERISELTPGKREVTVCPICRMTGTQKDEAWIGCDLCPTWLHLECTNVTDTEAPYICKPCRHADADEIDNEVKDKSHKSRSRRRKKTGETYSRR